MSRALVLVLMADCSHWWEELERRLLPPVDPGNGEPYARQCWHCGRYGKAARVLRRDPDEQTWRKP